MNQRAKPRICLLTETFHPVVGGGETQARALAEGLVGKAFGVLVVTRRSNAALPRRELIGPVPVYRMPPSGTAHLKKWGLLLTCAPMLLRLHRHYDLIFVSGFRVVGVTAVLLSKLLGKRCILKADSLGEMSGDFFAGGLARLGLRPTSRPFRAFLRLRNALLRRADAFVGISKVIADELAAHGIPARQIERIPNSVDTDRFHPVSAAEKRALRCKLGLPVAARVVIYTGRLVSYKGLPLLLEVWRTVRAQFNDARLLLVGSGGLDIHNCETELREFVAAQELRESVYFTGSVSNVEAYLQAADIFAFPTENEAFGISLIEAMACGLAVIGTAVGGMQDILEDGRNGLVIPANDSAQLQAALGRLLNDASLRQRLGTSARRHVMAHYAHDRVIRRYAEMFMAHAGQGLAS